MEKLAHLIQDKVSLGSWKPIKLNKNGPQISHLFFADDLIIFAEASMAQVDIINACLKTFCEASGQQVNNTKTRIFFSKNVNHNVSRQLSDSLGFTMAADLGKYLGVPLHHNRVTTNTYQFVLDKVRKRLANWKIHSLSLAGRNTLIKSVSSAIPNHSMQTGLLPVKICVEIDKANRRFLWGSTDEKRKAHLVAWDKICQSKTRWGLGIRHSAYQNRAFLMKLGWGLITNRDALWTNVMRGKYRCGNDTLPIIDKDRAGSRVWGGIKNIWHHMLDSVEVTVIRGEAQARWKYEKSGQFSLKTAYNLLTQENNQDRSIWTAMWKLKVPQRCKTHMWLLLHDKLMTNEAKFRRGLHADGMCRECPTNLENTLHMLRDCVHARQIWENLGISKTKYRFWSSGLQEWLCYNLREGKKSDHGQWKDRFAITCWILWRRRNERIHLNTLPSPSDCLAEVNGISRCMMKAASYQAHLGNNGKSKLLIPQRKEDLEEWVDIMVDGAFSYTSRVAGCAGILKDKEGVLLESFVCHLQGDNPLMAELWGCVWGLRRAWDSGHRRVRLFNDSKEVVGLVLSENLDLHEEKDLILMVQKLLRQDWVASIRHVNREVNFIADFLAKKSLGMNSGMQVVNAESIRRLLEEARIT